MRRDFMGFGEDVKEHNNYFGNAVDVVVVVVVGGDWHKKRSIYLSIYSRTGL